MSRLICISEARSGLCLNCTLLDGSAPHSANFLWKLAQENMVFDAIHAMWTGPEISCPLPANSLPGSLANNLIPEENSTSYPEAGDVVLASLAAGSVKGLPPGNFFDLGVFYGKGGRMLMPFGWIRANICAQVSPSDLQDAQATFRAIRQNGACQLSFQQVK